MNVTPLLHHRTIRCTAALALLGAAGLASAQVVDTPIPLNFNGHVMVHAGEQAPTVGVDLNSNADSILYRSIADRGLYWDVSNTHAFGSQPLVGGTGMTYSLFNQVGYANTTAANAAANGLDGIFLGSRVWDRGLEFAPTPLTSTGVQTSWAPVFDITSLTGDGTTATAVTAAAHGLSVGRRVAILGATPGAFDGDVVVTSVPNATTFTYASTATGSATGSIFTNSTKTAQALYVTSDGGATMAVKTITNHTFGVGGNNQITISGSSNPAYNVQGLVTATNVATALSGTGSGTVTATTTINHGFATGDSVTIAGASGGSGTWNGTFTVTVVDDKTFTYSASGNGTPTGTITATNSRVFYMANTGGGTGTATGTEIVAATDTHIGTETTVLSSPVTVDDNTEIGVLYMTSDSGGPFDVDLTFNNGSVDTVVPAKLASADWFGNATEVGTYSTFVSLHKRMTHTVSGTTYTTFQGCSNNDAATLQNFSTSNAGPNLQVTEGIISIPLYKTITGNSLAGQQLTKIAFKNPQTNQYTSVTNITSDGTTATVTLSSVQDYIVGQPIEIVGVAQTAVSTATGITGDGVTATVTTAAPHGLVTGQYITMSGATPSGFNDSTNNAQITVIDSTHFSYPNATIGTSTVAGTATVIAGAFPVNGKYTITGVNHIANQVTFPCAAVAPSTAAIVLVNNNLKITGATSSGGIVTFTTARPHGFSSAGGDMVTLSGFSAQQNLNGTFRTIDAPTTTTFRVRNPTTSSTTASRMLVRFGRGRGYSIYAATVRTGVPTNTTCASATAIGPAGPAGVSVTGTNSHAPVETSPPTHSCTTTGDNAVYYKYVAQGNNPITISTCSFFLTNLSVYTGSCGSLTQVTNACNAGTGTGCNGSSTTSSVNFVGAGGTTYYIRVAGQANAMGNFTLTVQEFTNASCAGAIPITSSDTAGTTIANANGGTTPCGGGFDTNAVWYMYTAVGVGSHTVEARTCLDGQSATSAWTPSPLVSGVTGVRPASCSSSTLIYPLDTTIAVYNMSDCGQPSPTPIACNDNGCSVSSRVQWTADAGTTYLIRVASKSSGYPGTGSPASGPTGPFVLHIDDPVHTDLPLPLQFNWNGICHGTAAMAGPEFFSEQCVTAPQSHENRTDLNGFRGISDRGLLFDPNNATPNAFNYGGTIGYQGLQYQVYSTPLQLDIVHIAQAGSYRGGGATGNFKPNTQTYPSPTDTTTQQGWLPAWLSGDPSTGAATYNHSSSSSNVSGVNATFGPDTKLGLIYHMTNLSANVGTFHVTLTFSDGFFATVTCDATDWFGGTSSIPCSASLPAALPAGIEAHRILGVYNAVQNWDRGDAAGSGQLKVAESIISTASLAAAGMDPTGHGTLQSIQIDSLTSTDAGSNLAIFAATLRDPASYSLNYGPSGVGTLTPNQLNAGGTGKMKVTVSRGSPPNNAISTVVVDASQLGLSGSFALNDSGSNGDTTANDNVWSANVSFPINSTPNSYTLPFMVTDSQGRQAMGNIIFSVVTPTGSLVPSTGVIAGVTSVHATFVFGTPNSISSIILDGTSIGLSNMLALNDAGTGGDTAANDGTWGLNFIPSAALVPGDYTVPYTITDTSSNMISGSLMITIIPPPPSNDDCSTPIVLSDGVTYTGDNSQGTSNDGAASTCQASVSKGVWFSFTPATTGQWQVSTCGTTQDTVLTVWNTGITCADTATQANILACNDDNGVGCTGLQASLQTTLNGGSTYLIRMSSYPSTAAGGAYQITVSPYVTGACCNNTTGACTMVAATGCSSTTSSYQGDNVVCPTTCAVTGVCCNNTTGACTSIYGGSCPSGTTSGQNSACDASSCPPSSSCCNNATGACTFIYGDFCPTGTTAGGNLACDATTCPPVGTCCDNVTGACSVIYGGVGCPGNATFNGDTACTASTCPQMQWACCFADGSCLSLYQLDCTGHSGAVWEPGQTCGVFVCPSCTNVLANPGAETGDMTGWTIDANGGNGWAAVSNAAEVHTGTYAFATSYGLGQRHQLIDLTQFFSPAQLDASPDISAGEYVHTRGDQGGQYYVLVQLLAADQTTVIDSFNDGTSAALTQLPAGTPYFLVSHTFSGYAAGVRYLRFEDGGRDIAGWAGNYGTHFDDAFAGPTQTTAACCSSAGCSVITNAACITAGGTPQGCGTSCSPSPCGGVCCRGSTCNSGVAQGACTTNGALAGAFFSTSGSTCNGSSTTSPCCYPDYNKLNGITVGDIFDFLNDWFAGQKFAIVGGDGTHGQLQVQNIFDFLNAWFAGGC